MATSSITAARTTGQSCHISGGLECFEQPVAKRTHLLRLANSHARKKVSKAVPLTKEQRRPCAASCIEFGGRQVGKRAGSLGSSKSQFQKFSIRAEAAASNSGEAPDAEPSTSGNQLPDEQPPMALDEDGTGPSASSNEQLSKEVDPTDAPLIKEEHVKDYGFLGELPAAVRVLLRMGPLYGLGLVVLQAFLWGLQETLQVLFVKLIRTIDPPALIIVNKLSVYAALAFLVLNMTYLALATGLSITAATHALAATLSNRQMRVKQIWKDWWTHARPLAMAQFKVYWPLLLMVIYAGLSGDKFLDTTREKQLEMIQEMKILNRINSLTLIALYPGLRLLRIAAFFTYFFYTLTVLPLLGLVGPAILLENISAKQATEQRRFFVRGFPLYRLLPLLVCIAVMTYFTFFTKAPLPINTLTVIEWSHQLRRRMVKAFWLALVCLIQGLLYISYRKKKEGEAFSIQQLAKHVDSGSGSTDSDTPKMA